MIQDDDDEYIPSWNGQRTSTPDRLAGCTVWFLGFIVLLVVGAAVGQAIEALVGK
jgi:hypothetical protein